jgi:hypothetical protein
MKMENSAIEWCVHTFNPWWGCTKVSPHSPHKMNRYYGQVGKAKWPAMLDGVEHKAWPASHRACDRMYDSVPLNQDIDGD